MQNYIYPSEIVGGAIAIYNNVWDDYQESIDLIEKLTLDPELTIEFEPSTILGDIDNKLNDEKKIRTSSNMHIGKYIDTNQYLNNFHKRCDDIVSLVLPGYVRHFGITEEIYNKEHFQLLKYTAGGKFDRHYDSFPAAQRAVSVLIYLNNDYEGGEIEFVNFGVKIKPKSGTLILFPSNYPYSHVAHPVTSGTKYVVVNWLHER
jgi:hypothetical protein